MGTVPCGARTIEVVTAVCVSVKKERRATLSTSDQIKLSRSAREGEVRNLPFSKLMEKLAMLLELCKIYI